MDDDEDTSFADYLKAATESVGKIYGAINPAQPANANNAAKQNQADFAKILPWAIGGLVVLVLVIVLAGRR